MSAHHASLSEIEAGANYHRRIRENAVKKYVGATPWSASNQTLVLVQVSRSYQRDKWVDKNKDVPAIKMV
jgi:hypothetical protein